MSGKNLPYHLRVKKDIERRLFVEQLRLVSKVYDLEEYSYVSMAGPFSEDFKLMSDRFNFKNFFSYEMDEDVYKRQKFNTPFNPIYYIHKNISEFSNNYPNIEAVELEDIVIWLDYTDFKFEFFENFERLISTLSKGSIIKMTLLTHISQIYSSDENVETMREKRVEKLKNILGENYFYSDIFKTENMTEKKFPKIICEVLTRIASNTLVGGTTKVLPLSSYIYRDGMTMLTFTGILLDENNVKDFLEKTGLDNWSYSLNFSVDPLVIDVPFLSLKEKYSLDACLPSSPNGELEYLKKKEFSSYEKFRKFYPTYAKII